MQNANDKDAWGNTTGVSYTDGIKEGLDMIFDGERSDLTLICEIELENDRVVKILVDDLHVL